MDPELFTIELKRFEARCFFALRLSLELFENHFGICIDQVNREVLSE